MKQVAGGFDISMYAPVLTHQSPVSLSVSLVCLLLQLILNHAYCTEYHKTVGLLDTMCIDVQFQFSYSAWNFGPCKFRSCCFKDMHGSVKMIRCAYLQKV